MIRQKTGTMIKAAEVDDSRILKFTASKQVRDRDNDLVYVGKNDKGAGILTADFDKNPVFLKIHDDHSWPIGKVISYQTTADGAGVPEFEITVEFADTDEGNLALYLYKNGFMNGVSIRFRPTEYVFNEQAKGFDIFTAILFEVSAVPLPANQEALLKKAFMSKDLTDEPKPEPAQGPDTAEPADDLTDIEITEADQKRLDVMIENLKATGSFSRARDMAKDILNALEKIKR